MKLKYLIIVLIFAFSTSVNAAIFNKKTFTNIGPGMSVDDVVETIGRGATVITMDADRSYTIRHLSTTHIDLDKVVKEGKYMIITYQTRPYKTTTFDLQYLVFTASIIFEDGLVIHMMGKETKLSN